VTEAARGAGRPTRWWIGAGVMVVAAIAIFSGLGHAAAGVLLDAAAGVQRAGGWAPLLFVLLYAAATVLLVPGSILTLAGGALFGLVRGTGLVFVAANLGATAAFLLARSAARPVVIRRLGSDPRIGAVDRALALRGASVALLLRLSPVVPFNLLNYALGLTAIRLRDFLLASLGMLPGTVLYVYSGTLLRTAADLARAGPARGTAYYAVLAVGLIATAAGVLVITRVARRALREFDEPTERAR
jgi:uncharacterized membrane protein YdjX (TVP38/TMEM64 family)